MMPASDGTRRELSLISHPSVLVVGVGLDWCSEASQSDFLWTRVVNDTGASVVNDTGASQHPCTVRFAGPGDHTHGNVR